MGPFELLKKIVDVLEDLQIPYLVTGAVASIAYGEPRLTNDIDIVADLKEEQVDSLMRAFPPDDFYMDEEMVRQAIQDHGQFNIIHPSSGLKVDVMIKKKTPHDKSRFERIRRIYPMGTYQADFAAPEDVIIERMEYYKEGGSDKHLRDIAGILKISGESVDRKYILEWAQRLGLLEIGGAIQKKLNEKS
jgi:hypothetical protein